LRNSVGIFNKEEQKLYEDSHCPFPSEKKKPETRAMDESSESPFINVESIDGDMPLKRSVTGMAPVAKINLNDVDTRIDKLLMESESKASSFLPPND
jgi:hypothetical protein